MKWNFWLGFGAGASVSIGLIAGWLFWDAGQVTVRLKNTGDETFKSLSINDVELGDIAPNDFRTASLGSVAVIGIDYLDDDQWVSQFLHSYNGRSELMLMTRNNDGLEEIQICPKPLSYLLGQF